ERHELAPFRLTELHGSASSVVRGTGFMECGTPGLFGLDVGRPDHLAPFLGLLGDELAEISGAHRHRHGTEIGEPRLDLGIGKSSIDLLVESVDDLRRCILWRAKAPDIAALVTRHKITYRREFWQCLRSPRRRHRKCA